MRLIFAGTPEPAVASLRVLAASDHDIALVVTRPDAPLGRKRIMTPSPVAQAADELGLPILKTPRFDEAATAVVQEADAELGVIVAYGGFVREPLLSLPRLGWINLHFSLLPRWRGAAPVQRAVMAGDTETGAGVCDIVPVLDAGDVYAELRTPIAPTETAGDLLARLADDGAGLLTRVMDELEAGTAVATPQPAAGVTIAPKLTVPEAEVDWANADEEIHRQIRGCTPAPGAWTTFRGERFKIHRAHPAGGEPLDPGVINAAKQWLQVGTGSRPLELDHVQPFGKKAMKAADWARGVDLAPGERFGT